MYFYFYLLVGLSTYKGDWNQCLKGFTLFGAAYAATLNKGTTKQKANWFINGKVKPV